ncbi:MAG: hypothetical protein JW850_07300 [Thermoflexales bacterium]|nr:hypothetical protein [Thermoflexales bacterium]
MEYAYRDSAGWHTQFVEKMMGENRIGKHTALALDGDGQPHISYDDHDDNNVKYAYRDSAGWHIQVVDHLWLTGTYSISSLRLDTLGYPHISYSTVDDLKYAQKLASMHLSMAASPLDGLTNHDSVTYTLTLSGTGQNATLWDPLPMGVYYVSGSLTSTLSPPAVYSPTARAITWQGILPTDAVGSMPTDTLELVRFQSTRGITTEGPLNLSLPIVNTAWLTDTENGTSIRATVIANGYRLYLPLVMREE